MNQSSGYSATLHRGWDVVRLNYRLEDDAVVVNEAHLWGGKTEKRVALANLERNARRIIARQPAYRYALILLQFCVLVIAGDCALAMLATPQRPIYAPVWWGAGIIIADCLYVMFKTRRAREWTYFPGTGKGRGLYVLQERGKSAEHKQFVEDITSAL